jgi:hypothetical protein
VAAVEPPGGELICGRVDAGELIQVTSFTTRTSSTTLWRTAWRQSRNPKCSAPAHTIDGKTAALWKPGGPFSGGGSLFKRARRDDQLRWRNREGRAASLADVLRVKLC